MGMSDAFWIAAFNAIVALATLIVTSYVNYNVNRTHNIVNSKMDAYLAITAKSSKAEGVLEGKEGKSAHIKTETKHIR